MKLILASTSPGRKKVLEDAGLTFDIVPSDFEEDMSLAMPSHDLAMHLSKGKAEAVARPLWGTDAIIIGADTFGVFENTFLGKPHTEKNATDMLKMLSDGVHSMVSGVTVINAKENLQITKSAETKIWFRHIPEHEIEAYVKTGESLTKAGGYAYQGAGHTFVKKIEGSESNIMGLPIELVLTMLTEVGYPINFYM